MNNKERIRALENLLEFKNKHIVDLEWKLASAETAYDFSQVQVTNTKTYRTGGLNRNDDMCRMTVDLPIRGALYHELFAIQKKKFYNECNETNGIDNTK